MREPGFAREFWQYLLDSCSLINIERNKGVRALEERKGALLISERVAFEVAFDPRVRKNDPLRKFVIHNRELIVTSFQDNEEEEYLRILQQPGIDPGEASVIAIASKRCLPLVIDERDTKATGKARNHGVRTLTWREFLET